MAGRFEGFSVNRSTKLESIWTDVGLSGGVALVTSRSPSQSLTANARVRPTAPVSGFSGFSATAFPRASLNCRLHQSNSNRLEVIQPAFTKFPNSSDRVVEMVLFFAEVATKAQQLKPSSPPRKNAPHWRKLKLQLAFTAAATALGDPELAKEGEVNERPALIRRRARDRVEELTLGLQEGTVRPSEFADDFKSAWSIAYGPDIASGPDNWS